MKKILFLFCLLYFAELLPAQNKNVFQISKAEIDTVYRIALDKFWKFHNGDDSLWATSSFDDSRWDTANTMLPFNKNDSNVFKGIAWFRVHINIDSLLNDVPLCLFVNQSGASQIFLDGKLIHSLGKVSASLKEEKKYTPTVPISFHYHKSGEHLLSVRYSNLNFRKLFEKYESDAAYPGFNLLLADLDTAIFSNASNTFFNNSLSLILGIFFLTLSFVHFLLFLFYKKHSTNLYYSIFVFIFGFLYIILLITDNSNDPELAAAFQYYFLFYLLFFFYSLLILHYSLFKIPFGKYFLFSTLILVVAIIELIFKNKFTNGLVYIFIINTVFASLFIVIRSILRKLDGAWIIGTGSIIFSTLVGFAIANIFFSDNFLIDSDFLLYLAVLSAMSISISMAVYLARQFATTNKVLEKKFIEVKTLSEKTIIQEKEKQKILETQKETLEIQVSERTSEIVEQKTIIEKKNKDITDSIDYAKTIQDAILPSVELQHLLFPDSFILFKPKDIVSGDFYWFAEKDGKKIIAACDCTGHGVPGALMSMIGNNILNQIVIEKGITSPNEILNQLHNEIRKTLNQEKQSETKDGMDIALISFNNELEIEFAGAQRPIWIIRTQQESPLTEIKGNKFAIGGIQSETERTFTNHKISLSKGECIYIFSDGFADQFSDTDKKLMTSRFKETLLSIQDKSMPDQQKFLDTFIENWRGKREQIDDILVIGIKV